MKKRNTLKQVYLTFKPHPPGEPYSKRAQPPENISSVVFEHSKGHRGKTMGLKGLKGLSESGRYHKTGKSYFISAHLAGKRVMPGERIAKKDEGHKLKRLLRNANIALATARQNPTLKNIMAFFVEDAEFDKFRHFLIRRTILSEIKNGSVEAQYGSGHDVLVEELRKELSKRAMHNVRVTARREPSHYRLDIIVFRKLVRGILPSKISPLDYKKAFLARIAGESETYKRIVLRKSVLEIESKHSIFFDVVIDTLLSRLAPKQIDEILEQQQSHSKSHIDSASEYVWRSALKFNGFPDIDFDPESTLKFVNFLNRHGPIWWKKHEKKNYGLKK